MVNIDLDRYLRSGKILVVLSDEEEKEWVYGYCKIPLGSLAQGQRIDQIFEIEGADGIACGTLQARLFWDSPYQSLDKPTISLMDDPALKQEMGAAKPNEHNLLLTTIAPKIDMKISDTPSPSLIEIWVSKIKLNSENDLVREYLKDVRQYFVGVEVFGFTGERMESQSLVLEQEGNTEMVSFEIALPYDEIIESIEGNRLKLIENKDNEQIVFSIVDEPPADSDLTECTDIAFAAISLNDIINSEKRPMGILITAKDNKTLVVGVLEIQVAGFSEFYRFLANQQ